MLWKLELHLLWFVFSVKCGRRKLISIMNVFLSRAVTLHSSHVLDDWHDVYSSSVNYYVVPNLQPCSEYEFKVQVLFQGGSSGPYSATVKATTLTASKYNL